MDYKLNEGTVEFFETMHKEGMDLTFDDLLLKPRYSEILPKDTEVTGHFSRNIPLKNAVASSAMDTVTEAKLAIAIAMCGGIGVIHKNMLPEDQREEVRKVKNMLHGKIEAPVTFTQEATLGETREIMKERNYSFNTFPVLEKNKLVGLLTNNVFKFTKDDSKKIKDVMVKNLITAKETTTIDEAYNIMLKDHKGVLPLVDEDNNFKGMYIFSDVDNIVNGARLNHNVDKKGRLRVAASVGVTYNNEIEWERVDALVSENVDAVVIDTAHGHTKGVIETVKQIKKKYPNLDVVAGNVSTAEATRKLIEAGADGIKVGQGPGSICTTRIVTGSGAAQVSAIFNCANAANGKVPIIADGGIRYSGDIVKAFAAGATCVMMGSIFASCIEAPGETVKIHGVDYRVYRGMGSPSAMKNWKGSRERYGHKEIDSKTVAEGIEGKVLIKGPLEFVFNQLIGGVKSGLGNSGAKDVQELQKKAKFRRVSPSGLNESHPHDINFMEDSPNYQSGR